MVFDAGKRWKIQGRNSGDNMGTIKSATFPIGDPVFQAGFPRRRRLRILVADDHPIVRRSLKGILERIGFRVIAEASNGEEAVARAVALKPDVAVLDIAMPVKNGIDAAQEILATVPKTKTILLTVHREGHYVRQALRAGVRGYVVKSRSSEELVQAIYTVYQGKTYLSVEIDPEIVRDYPLKTH